jgi:hypothetical protein
MSVTFTKERGTQNELVYKCVAGVGTVGSKNNGTLVNNAVAATPNIQKDVIASSPLALLLSQACPAVTELSDLEGSAGFNGSLPIGALDVWLVPGSEQQLLGSSDYALWGITVTPDATSGYPAFVVQGPSAGGTATLTISNRHSRIL